MDAKAIDESGYYLKDTVALAAGNNARLHGAEGGPFPYSSKAVASAAAAKKNGRFGKRRYVVVTWLLGRQV